MGVKPMSKPLSLYTQADMLRRAYHGCEIKISRVCLTWRYNMHPSEWSQSYTVKIRYFRNNKGRWVPSTYINFPRLLPLAEGQNRLPHVYNHEAQEICLYDWREHEWDASMSIAETIVPWASEWLYNYEAWVMTGQWYGGGHYPESEIKKETDKEENK